MRDELYAEGSERAIREVALREPTMVRKEPEFGFWRTVGSVGKASIAGISETAATGSEIIKGFGQVSAATMPATMFGNVTQDQGKEQKDEMERIRREGVDMNSEVGRALRSSAKDYMPDPETSHQAEVIIADFSRIMTKAVGSTLLTGTPIPAALEEGVTTADKLQEKGIDKETAVKVGLVTGAANAVAFGLPIAGQTLKSTIGLAAASGPATYIAQESATRKILEDANYDNEAALHDPFNPLGLGLATVGSFIPGALVLGLRSRAARTTPAPSRAQVDAARVQVARDALDSNILAPIEDVPARTAQRKAIEATHEQLSRGDPVSLTKAVPEEAYARVGESKPFIDFVAKVDEVVTAAKPEPEAPTWFSSSTVRELEVLDPAKARDGNLYGPAVYMAKDQAVSATYARGGIDQKTGQRLPDGEVYAADFVPEKVFDTDKVMSAKEAFALAKSMGAEKLPGLEGKPKVAGSTLYKELTKALGGKAAVNKALAAQGFDGIAFKQNGAELMAALKQVPVRRPTPKQGDVAAAGNKGALPKDGAPAAAGMEAATTGRAAVDSPSTAPGEARPTEKQAGGEGAPTATTEVARLADEMETNYPDMLVEMDGMPAMAVKDFMEAIRAQVADELSEVPLIQAATTCFLTFGSSS